MKTLGILGGLGPQTTTKIYHSIIDSFRKNGFERYPSIVIYNLPFPFAVENEAIIEGHNADKMIPYLIEGAKVLEKSGASFGILPCNTLHRFIDTIRESVKISFLSILDETSKILESSNIKSVGVLATLSSVNDRLYDSVLEKNKINVIYPSNDIQHDLDKLIVRLINNNETKDDKKRFEEICNNLVKSGANAILLACTDLQCIAKDIKLNIPIIDTTQILIEASLRELIGK